MEDMGKEVKVRTANNKMVEYRQQRNVAMQLLVRSQAPELNIDLAYLMRYPFPGENDGQMTMEYHGNPW